MGYEVLIDIKKTITNLSELPYKYIAVMTIFTIISIKIP